MPVTIVVVVVVVEVVPAFVAFVSFFFFVAFCCLLFACFFFSFFFLGPRWRLGAGAFLVKTLLGVSLCFVFVKVLSTLARA